MNLLSGSYFAAALLGQLLLARTRGGLFCTLGVFSVSGCNERGPPAANVAQIDGEEVQWSLTVTHEFGEDRQMRFLSRKPRAALKGQLPYFVQLAQSMSKLAMTEADFVYGEVLEEREVQDDWNRDGTEMRIRFEVSGQEAIRLIKLSGSKLPSGETLLRGTFKGPVDDEVIAAWTAWVADNFILPCRIEQDEDTQVLKAYFKTK